MHISTVAKLFGQRRHVRFAPEAVMAFVPLDPAGTAPDNSMYPKRRDRGRAGEGL